MFLVPVLNSKYKIPVGVSFDFDKSVGTPSLRH